MVSFQYHPAILRWRGKFARRLGRGDSTGGVNSREPRRRSTAREGDTMHIAVSGSSGLVGSALISFLTREGHRVTRLVRRAAAGGEVAWDIAQGVRDLSHLEGVGGGVHLG